MKHVEQAGHDPQISSLPMRERGLKHTTDDTDNILKTVAPHAGAWIETLRNKCAPEYDIVAPHAGAWIETFVVDGINDFF